MQKKFVVSAVLACCVASASFAEGLTNGVSRVTEAPAELEEESPAIFSAGFDFDFLSAYVWRNAISTDEMVMQPCVWADLTYFEPFWLGFSIWQNYDLTDRRCNQFKYGLNETDYNVHLGATAWESEDEAYSVSAEIGHDWYTYQGVRDGIVYPDLVPAISTVDTYRNGTIIHPGYEDLFTVGLSVTMSHDSPSETERPGIAFDGKVGALTRTDWAWRTLKRMDDN